MDNGSKTARATWSTGEAARRLGVPRHRLSYLFESGRVSEPLRIGGRRMVDAETLRAIACALGLNWRPSGESGVEGRA